MLQDPLLSMPTTDTARKPNNTSSSATPPPVLKCPRCDSMNTKFCYFNNYNLAQPRHFCKNCRRYWTQGGTLRNVPVGGGSRKNKRVSRVHRPPIDPRTFAPIEDPSLFLNTGRPIATTYSPLSHNGFEGPLTDYEAFSSPLSMTFTSCLPDSVQLHQPATNSLYPCAPNASVPLLPLIANMLPSTTFGNTMPNPGGGSTLIYDNSHLDNAPANVMLSSVDGQVPAFGSCLLDHDQHPQPPAEAFQAAHIQAHHLGLQLYPRTARNQEQNLTDQHHGVPQSQLQEFLMHDSVSQETWSPRRAQPAADSLYEGTTSARQGHQNVNFWNQMGWVYASSAPAASSTTSTQPL